MSLFRNSLVFATLLAATGPAFGQYYRSQILEPQALRLQITNVYTGLRLEASDERTTYSDSSGNSTFKRLFLGPVFGLDANGSIYHPNLLTFSIDGEFSPGYEYQRSNAPGFEDKNGPMMLGNYQVNATLLGNQPYRLSLYGGQSYNYRDLDFFNQVEVFGWRYGAIWGYQKGPVPFSINVWRRSEDTNGALFNSSLLETGLEFNARNTRASGETSLNYTLTDTTRTDGDSHADDNWQSIALGNTENFGSHQQMVLNTNVGYTNHTSTNNPTDDLTATANFQIQHTPTLTSIYDLDYDRTTNDTSAGTSKTNNLNGGISLRHQLYESLTSTLRLQGIEFDSDGSFQDSNGRNNSSRDNNTRLGIMLTEQYTKKLGSIGRLTAVGSVLVEHVDVSNGGQMLIVNDERHSFASYSSGSAISGNDTFFLNLPYVDETTIVITDDKNNFPAYQEGRDYTVSTNGAMTMIRRTGNSTILQNSTVFVDYRAKASPSGQYEAVTSLLNTRIDLWNGLVSVYGRINSSQGNAPEGLLFVQQRNTAVGAETSWRWLRAGVEYENNNNRFSTYHSTRFFQSLAFKPDAFSTLSFDLNQTFTQYIDSDRNENDYLFMVRYQRRLARNFALHLDGGYSWMQSEGNDQSQAAIRPGVEFNLGRLSVQASYSLESWKYQPSTDRLKQQLIISARRDF
jgi:hypothetical protein